MSSLFIATVFALAYGFLSGIAWRATSTLGPYFIARFATSAAIYGAFYNFARNSFREPVDILFARSVTWVAACAFLYLGTVVGGYIDSRFRTAARTRAVKHAMRAIIQGSKK